MKYYVNIGGTDREVTLEEKGGEWIVAVDGRSIDVTYREVDRLGQVAMTVDGRAFGVSIEGDESSAKVVVAGRAFDVELEDERERAAHAAERARAKKGGDLKSVMPGVVVQLLVNEGDQVEEGQPLLILEAMKMQNEIGASASGVVKKVHVAEGEAVGSGAKLLTLGE